MKHRFIQYVAINPEDGLEQERIVLDIMTRTATRYYPEDFQFGDEGKSLPLRVAGSLIGNWAWLARQAPDVFSLEIHRC